MAWAEMCSICGNDVLWWTSKTGYQVCMRCNPEPFGALATLARRGRPGLMKEVQRWWTIDQDN